ncbi:hypothetical protein [Cellulomonas sp. KRMCY2]|uniref:hypothetical protein n=1 Tax=Cellulomonas sp. KRMCY2 TaxID=1304865 RepID=UPI00045E9206|nr:hypothetical protein [Cellulomonas sp. KRMCY2]
MRRLFWVGVGAVGAVVAVDRLRTAVRRYTPAGVSDRAEDVGRRTTSALRGAVEQFRSAKDQRERDLVATLLVTPEGGDAAAGLDGLSGRRRRHDPDPDFTAPAYNTPSGTDELADAEQSPGTRRRPAGRVDDDEPLYDF